MAFPGKSPEISKADAAQLIETEVKLFVRTNSLNRMPMSGSDFIFDEPLVQFAGGDAPIFSEYKTIIDPTHLTPREALAAALNKELEDLADHLSVISWILPIAVQTRQSNRRHKSTPSLRWIYTRHYGEEFNNALREHVVKLLSGMGYLATAPMLQPYFGITYQAEGIGHFSNWSERHIAYAAGLGTFSISDGFITERGIAHRCGSVVTDLGLPASPMTGDNPYANCAFYTDNKCTACMTRCPAGAISEQGHDKIICREYLNGDLGHLQEKYGWDKIGCGLCQVNVPCEFRNPMQMVDKVDTATD